MPADADFIRLIRSNVRDRGGRVIECPAPDRAGNPFRFRFELGQDHYGAFIHVREITPQSGEGTTHGRPEGEWHAQMIFDGDQRGAGVRNELETEPDMPTVLCGFAYLEDEDEMVIAAWDPEHHADYSYSKSLQVREETLRSAVDGGLAQQPRQTGEIIVAFRPQFLPEYLSNRGNWHGSALPTEEGEESEGTEEEEITVEAPPDEDGRQGRRRVSGTRAARDVRFRNYIHDHYPCCATCGLESESLLEAAHIIPVGEEGSDHFSNGIRLCKNCHALFDAGLLVIQPSYEVDLAAAVQRDFPDDAERLARDLEDRLLVPNIPEEYRPDPDKLQQVIEERWHSGSG